MSRPSGAPIGPTAGGRRACDARPRRRPPRPARDPRARRALGRLARRRRLGAVPHRLARRRPHDGDLDTGDGGRVHRDEQGGVGDGRPDPPRPRRAVRGRGREPGDLPGQDGDPPARGGRRRRGRRHVQRALLRLPGEAGRPLGARAAPADLRARPDGPGRPCRAPRARSRPAGPVPRGIPAPRVPADAGRLRGEARHAGAAGPRGRGPLRERRRLARAAPARGADPLDAPEPPGATRWRGAIEAGSSRVAIVPRTVRDAAFDVLREHGLTTLFANPGSTEISLLADLPDDLRFVLGLHESSVVGMATGFALGRREPALAILHTTPGLGNAVSALATARVNRAPLVVVVGQQDRRHLATEPFLAGKLHGLAGEYPVWVDQPVRAQGVPGSIARAYHEALTGRGPALVIVPMDDWEAEAGAPEERAAPRRVLRSDAADDGGRRRARRRARRRRAAGARRRGRNGRRRRVAIGRRARGAALVPRLAGVVQRAGRLPAGPPALRRPSRGRPAAAARQALVPARRRARGRRAGVPAVRVRAGAVRRARDARR